MGPVLIYSSAEADVVKKVQRKHGVENATILIEKCLARISRELVRAGARRLAGVGRVIVAGGITASESLKSLKIQSLRIGHEINPGVPWTMTFDTPPVHLALKASNFGDEDFFTRAFRLLK